MPLLEDQLSFALYAASRAVVTAYQPFLAPLGLTYPQYLVMLCLWEKDGVTVSHLGERLHLDSGTLTPLLKRMETQKLLARKRDKEDERKVLVHLTASGKKLSAKAPAVMSGIFCSLGSNLDEIVRLRTSLKKLIARLNQEPVPQSATTANKGSAS
jgi:DNA-binding MarR family transcriptional regulator